jgi:hypothetical protein
MAADKVLDEHKGIAKRPVQGRPGEMHDDGGEGAPPLKALQQTIGNQAVQRFIQRRTGVLKGKEQVPHPMQTGTGKTEAAPEEVGILARSQLAEPGAAVAIQRRGGPAKVATIVGTALAGVSILPSHINGVNGGLVYTSDQVTYPKDLEQVDLRAPEHTRRAACFFSKGLLENDSTMFIMHGNFGRDSKGRLIMANVYIDLESTTTYSGSELSFNARAMQTPYGTPDSPKIRFVCYGRFNPAGSGDCSYRVELEVNQSGFVKVVKAQKVSGQGDLRDRSPYGFTLVI